MVLSKNNFCCYGYCIGLIFGFFWQSGGICRHLFPSVLKAKLFDLTKNTVFSICCFSYSLTYFKKFNLALLKCCFKLQLYDLNDTFFLKIFLKPNTRFSSLLLPTGITFLLAMM